MDAGSLTSEQQAALRRQAVGWLNADLARWTKELDRGNVSGILFMIDHVLPELRTEKGLRTLRFGSRQ